MVKIVDMDGPLNCYCFFRSIYFWNCSSKFTRKPCCNVTNYIGFWLFDGLGPSMFPIMENNCFNFNRYTYFYHKLDSLIFWVSHHMLSRKTNFEFSRTFYQNLIQSILILAFINIVLKFVSTFWHIFSKS